MWVALFITFIFASFVLFVVKGFVIDDVFLITFGIMITQVNLIVIIVKGFTFFFSNYKNTVTKNLFACVGTLVFRILNIHSYKRI